MRFPRALAIFGTAFGAWSLAVAPSPAFALDGSVVVPDWLSIAAGGLGLVISALLLAEGLFLRKVAEGSMVAVNIGYMMSAVACFAVAMILRWVGMFSDDAVLAEQTAFAAELLVTTGMALLAVYFYRVRSTITGYLRALSDMETGTTGGDSPEESDG
ncbi:MAG: hypothetical protein OEV43_01285 [Coriobacteriia bacterium]|nr:hypothetical protein [Coriobacteriia bacterium]